MRIELSMILSRSPPGPTPTCGLIEATPRLRFGLGRALAVSVAACAASIARRAACNSRFFCNSRASAAERLKLAKSGVWACAGAVRQHSNSRMISKRKNFSKSKLS